MIKRRIVTEGCIDAIDEYSYYYVFIINDLRNVDYSEMYPYDLIFHTCTMYFTGMRIHNMYPYHRSWNTAVSRVTGVYASCIDFLRRLKLRREHT